MSEKIYSIEELKEKLKDILKNDSVKSFMENNTDRKVTKI